MRFSSSILLIATTAFGFTNAIPTPDELDVGDNDSLPTPAAVAAVEAAPTVTIIPLAHAGYAYRDADLSGTRWSLTSLGGPNSCHEVYSFNGNDEWTSIEVFRGYQCKFYRNIFCMKNLPFEEGGEMKRTGPWQGHVPAGWNNRISSYKCDHYQS